MRDLAAIDCEEGAKMEEEIEEVRVVKEEEEEKTKKREERESGVVRWEEYLPKMVIRVLLVEADDSTRQIIAALLRKCNYKVAAIPDGLTAWEILKRRHRNIDLILTEVDLPSISGYALLTLIMEHDGCKNIPVIMMSACDSISMVFRCMLKGAADFLVKPVRRNELKNLWQHVWRRISITNKQGQQNFLSSPCKIKDRSKEARNHSDDDASSSLKNSQSSEKASATQDFSQLALKQMELSTLSHGELERHGNSMKSRIGITVLEGEREVRLEVDGCNVESDAQDEKIRSESCTAGGHGTDRKKQHYKKDAIEAIDLIGRINDHCDHNSSYQLSSINEMHGVIITTPELELSLKRSEDTDDQATNAKKQKLNHSNASAFSRYSSDKKLQTFFSSTESISSTQIKGESKRNAKFPSTEEACNYPWSVNALSSKEESERTHVVSPSKDPDLAYSVPQTGFLPLPGVEFGPIFPPMLGSPTTHQALSSKPVVHQKESSSLLTSQSLHSDLGTYDLTMGHSSFDETSNQEHNTAVSVDQQRYANCGGPCQSTTANSTMCSGSGSGSGSGSSDGLINKSTTTTTEDEHVYDNSTMSNDVSVHDSQLSRGKGSLFSSQREAALARFRQKRKDRCYEKKVRYQSRKRLAEQRPRVKGQFVRQMLNDQPIAHW